MTALVDKKCGLMLPLYDANCPNKAMVNLNKGLVIFILIAFTGISVAYIYGLLEIVELRKDVEAMKKTLDNLKATKVNDFIIDENFNLFGPYIDDADVDDDEDEYDEENSNGFEYEEENQSETPFNSFETGLNSPKQEEEYIEESTLSPMELTKDFKHKSKRAKRTVLAETIDGVEINAEPYSEIKHENKTLKLYKLISSPITQPGFHSPAWTSHITTNPSFKHYEEVSTPPTSSILTRKSRVMHLEDKSKAFKQIVKKPKVKSLEQKNIQEQVAAPEMTVHKSNRHKHQRHRQKMVESLDETQMTILRPAKRTIAAHFNGDTSKYVLGQHTNFNGNGHMRHPDKTYIDWKASDWMKNLNMDQFFQMNDGALTIKEAGIYLVYAQIYYLDAHDMNGYRVYRNGETILQCTTMTHSKERIMKGNTCYTAAVEYLTDGDRVSIKDLSEGRYSLFENGKSFIGVIKLGDARNK